MTRSALGRWQGFTGGERKPQPGTEGRVSVERQGLEEVRPVGEAVVIIGEQEHGA